MSNKWGSPHLGGGYDSYFKDVVPNDIAKTIIAPNGYDFVGWTYVKDDDQTFAKPGDYIFHITKNLSPKFTIYAYYELHTYTGNITITHCKSNDETTYTFNYTIESTLNPITITADDDHDYYVPKEVTVTVDDKEEKVDYKYTPAEGMKSATFEFTSKMPASDLSVAGDATRLYYARLDYPENSLTITQNKPSYDFNDKATITIESVQNTDGRFTYSLPQTIEVTDDDGNAITSYTYEIDPSTGVNENTKATFTYTFNTETDVHIKLEPIARNYVTYTPSQHVNMTTTIAPYYLVGNSEDFTFEWVKDEVSGTEYSVPKYVQFNEDAESTIECPHYSPNNSTFTATFSDAPGALLELLDAGGGRKRGYVTDITVTGTQLSADEIVEPITDFKTSFWHRDDNIDSSGEPNTSIGFSVKLKRGWSTGHTNYYINNTYVGESYSHSHPTTSGEPHSFGSSPIYVNDMGPIKLEINLFKVYFINTDGVHNLRCEVKEHDSYVDVESDSEISVGEIVDVKIRGTSFYDVPTDPTDYVISTGAHMVPGTFTFDGDYEVTFEIQFDGIPGDTTGNDITLSVEGIPRS